MKFFKKIFEEPIFYLTKEAFKYSNNKFKFIVSIILKILGELIVLINPLIFGLIINIIQLEGINDSNISKITLICLSYIIINLGFYIFYIPGRLIERKNSFWINYNYRKHLLENTFKLPFSFHIDSKSGDIISKINNSSNALLRFSDNFFLVIFNTQGLIFPMIAIILLSPISFFFIISTYGLIFLWYCWIEKKLIKDYKKFDEYDNELSEKTYDLISNRNTIKTLRAEKILIKDIKNLMKKPYKLFLKNIKVNEIKWTVFGLLLNLQKVGILLSYIYTQINSDGIVLLGTLTILYSYVNWINGRFYSFITFYSDKSREKVSFKNAEEIKKNFKNIRTENYSKLENDWKIIEIKNLNFNYSNTQKNEHNLKNLEIKIKRKEKIMIIGESGSGKTTLLKILRGLYEPQKVKTLINKIPEIDGLKKLSDNSILIPQEPEIFIKTIRENITLNLEKTNDEIKKYSDLAEFTKVVNKLPNKWESKINEKGVNLSVGEKQRLALTRALLFSKNKEFLLLDESTSSVDSETERKIYENIFKEFNEKTIITVTHNLGILNFFDKIILINNGKIVCQGTLKKLKKNNKTFLKLLKTYEKNQNQ